MVAWLLYLGVTVTAGFVLAFVVGLIKASRSAQDTNPFTILLFSMVLAIGVPFAYVEVLTRSVGSQLQSAVQKAFEDSPLEGHMQYFRVTSYGSEKAKALAIGEERTRWGGLDRPVLEVTLEHEAAGWKPVAYKILESEKLNRDGLVFPPYH